MPQSVTPPKAPETPKAKAPVDPVLEARYNELRARMGKSKLTVVAPEGFTPYWARKDDTSELARLDYLGFRVVREQTSPVDGKVPTKRYQAQGYRADGTYVMGDVILMEIKTEDYQGYLYLNSERSQQMTQAAKDQFVEDAAKVGAPTFQVKRKA